MGLGACALLVVVVGCVDVGGCDCVLSAVVRSWIVCSLLFASCCGAGVSVGCMILVERVMFVWLLCCETCSLFLACVVRVALTCVEDGVAGGGPGKPSCCSGRGGRVGGALEGET